MYRHHMFSDSKYTPPPTLVYYVNYPLNILCRVHFFRFLLNGFKVCNYLELIVHNCEIFVWSITNFNKGFRKLKINSKCCKYISPPL